MSKLEAIKFDTDHFRLDILDQTLLPDQLQYVNIATCNDAHHAIRQMQVRGAPAIAAVACLSIVVELNHLEQKKDKQSLIKLINQRADHLVSSRPTAVNLRFALGVLVNFSERSSIELEESEEIIHQISEFCVMAMSRGVELNIRLSNFGAELLISRRPKSTGGITILTHCNTGALATVGYGTALGVIRSLRDKKLLDRVYCTETRPYNQGSRLTAYELVHEGIPATLICDNMVASLMSCKGDIDAVIVGADCVAANGDTANKIGTYQISVIAKHFGVSFYVAAPSQSIDLSLECGDRIHVEQRPANEVKFFGSTRIAPADIDVWNPGFDITPGHMIDAIITELGCFKVEELITKLAQKLQHEANNGQLCF